ncbi:hypothetical protein [Microbulbifer rhizosphaerae]|uniref:Uncharacterized protein n=1 Tax=Microbulbifer rhizosphaerae TaxID=1562603 RepID=A0A7W4WF82_9GAMM|nr:hypothetical protein [Microbulbifer rhizosphaerae]MBB3063099.1 hypothetical protein [Microbulbifer rhizosphaerae]
MNDQIHPPVKQINPYLLLFVGIAMCSVPLVFIGRFPEQFAAAQLPLSLFMALGAGLVGAAIPGAIHVKLPGIQAAGAAAMFALVLYLGNPSAEQKLVEEYAATDGTAPLNQLSAQSDIPTNPQDDNEIARELPENPIDLPRLAERSGTADADGEIEAVVVPVTGTVEQPSGWIYLGHKTMFGNWGIRYFNGNGLPQQGDVITVMSDRPRPLMDQSPKLKGLRYDFGNQIAEASPDTRLKVEKVKVVGLGKVWAQVQPYSENRG